MSCANYLECFKEKLSIVEEYEWLVGKHPGIVKDKLDAAGVTRTPTATQTKDVEETTRDKMLAMAYLTGANSRHYGEMMRELKVDFLKGHMDYPTSLITACHCWNTTPHQSSSNHRDFRTLTVSHLPT